LAATAAASKCKRTYGPPCTVCAGSVVASSIEEFLFQK
jgi:hypothetical protein